jgi:hypothetical protein
MLLRALSPVQSSQTEVIMSMSQPGKLAMRTRIASRLFLALVAVLSAYGTAQPVRAQEKKAADQPPGRELVPPGEQAAHGQASLVVAGYTRPGNPPDRERGGKILPGGYLAGNPDFHGLGGTVFFAVFRLTRETGDVWGTGVKDFDTAFIPGVDYNDIDSPGLDTRAKYLYLYQVVNSRGLDPISPMIFAANADKGTQPIASTAVRLRVDPRYITSWGHFKSEGFTLAVMPEQLDGKRGKGVVGVVGDKKNGAVRPAFEEDQDKEGTLRMAVSVNPSILGSLDMNAYLWNAPAHRLERMRVNSATLNLADSPAARELEKRTQNLKKNNARPAAWVEGMLKAARTATPPALVRLVQSEPDARLFLQADWTPTGKGFLNLADHSTVFGFTTDLPPVPEPVGIATPDGRPALLPVLGDLAGDGPAAAMVPGANGGGPAEVETIEEDMVLALAPGVATGVAPGTVVGPVQPAALMPSFAGPGLGTALPNLGGFGAGIPFANVGGIGTAPPPLWGGGGGFSGGGTVGTVGTTNGTPANVVVNTGPVNVTVTAGNQSQTTTVNTNISLQNQQSQSQSQAQAQAQAQAQSQSQSQNQTSCGQHVVPEPGAVVLALLGLPLLLLLACFRRRKIAAAMVHA